jgi:desulfoferrodoxin (superoxide reductase-like protein)
MNAKIADIRKELINIGKEVAANNTTTHFPDWCLLKIGVQAIQGITFDPEYWKDRIKKTPDCNDDSKY